MAGLLCVLLFIASHIHFPGYSVFGLCNYNHEVYEAGSSLRNPSLDCFVCANTMVCSLLMQIGMIQAATDMLECTCVYVANTKMNNVVSVEYGVIYCMCCVFMERSAPVCSCQQHSM